MILVMYILFKHIKLKMLVSSPALQQIKDVGAVTRQEDITPNIECTCKIYFDAKFINFRLNDFCNSKITKIETAEDTCSPRQLKLCYLFLTHNTMYQ